MHDPLGIARCSNVKVSSSHQKIVTFFATDVEFGCTMMLRIPNAAAERFVYNEHYRLYLEKEERRIFMG